MLLSPFFAKGNQGTKIGAFLWVLQEASDCAENSGGVSRFLKQCWWCRKEERRLSGCFQGGELTDEKASLVFSFKKKKIKNLKQCSQNFKIENVGRLRASQPEELLQGNETCVPHGPKTRAVSLVRWCRAEDQVLGEPMGDQELGETSQSPLNYDTTFFNSSFSVQTFFSKGWCQITSCEDLQTFNHQSGL